MDSAGPITDGDRQLAAKVGHVNVAIIAYQGNPVAEEQVPITFALIDQFKPDLYIPGLFEKIRETLPRTKTRYPLYRSPICLDISK